MTESNDKRARRIATDELNLAINHELAAIKADAEARDQRRQADVPLEVIARLGYDLDELELGHPSYEVARLSMKTRFGALAREAVGRRDAPPEPEPEIGDPPTPPETVTAENPD